jgi:23S rRNA (guanosine2251-2'-O)-methyltransferase
MALSSSYVKILHVDCTSQVFNEWPILKKIQNSVNIQLRDIDFFKASSKHQGIQIRAQLTVFKSLDECEVDTWRTVLVLDHLHDPMNIGSAIRHAVAFNVDAIILPRHNASPITEAVAHASSGALFAIPIIQAGSFGQCLDRLKEHGFGLIGTTLSERTEVFSRNHFWNKTAIVIGHEGKGLSHGIEKKCDSLVTIAMSNKIQSLNAAVTASIMCYERFKQLTTA